MTFACTTSCVNCLRKRVRHAYETHDLALLVRRVRTRLSSGWSIFECIKEEWREVRRQGRQPDDTWMLIVRSFPAC